MSGFDSKQDYDEGRAQDELLRPYIPGRDRPRLPPPPVLREQLAEEYAKIKAGGPPTMWDVDRDGIHDVICVAIAGLGEFTLTTEQARQLGSALLAEVEIATKRVEFTVRYVEEPPFATGEPAPWAICDRDGVVERFTSEEEARDALVEYQR